MSAGEENLNVERARYGTARFEIAMNICEKLDPETLEIIFHKGNGANQSEIGDVLGVTRQTAKGRIETAEISLRETILAFDLDATDYKDVLAALMDVLGVRKGEVFA
jgi:DNA-binding XRE family transcriptional regulator